MSGKAFTANNNLRKDIDVRRRDLWDALSREYREKSILLDSTHADPHVYVNVQGGNADQDEPAASTSEARKRQHYARPGYAPFDEWSHKLATLAFENALDALG